MSGHLENQVFPMSLLGVCNKDLNFSNYLARMSNVDLCIGFEWQSFGSQVATGVASLRS